jgi:hypothetical protein
MRSDHGYILPMIETENISIFIRKSDLCRISKRLPWWSFAIEKRRCKMGNEEENEKRRIIPEKALEMCKTAAADLTLEQGERMPCETKKNGVSNLDRLTVEELRRCVGFDKVSESETIEIIESLFQLAIVVYNLKE